MDKKKYRDLEKILKGVASHRRIQIVDLLNEHITRRALAEASQDQLPPDDILARTYVNVEGLQEWTEVENP